MAFSRVSAEYLDIPSFCEMKDEPTFMHCRESRHILCQGISGSIPLEAENTESLSHTYF